MAGSAISRILRQPGLVALLGLPPLTLLVRRWAPELDPSFWNPTFHLVVVGGIAVAATVVAAVAARATSRTASNAGPVLLSAGCLALGILMTGHGLLTPGVLGQSFNPWVARLPWIAVLLFAVSLALAARPASALHRRIVAHPKAVIVATVGVLAPAVGFVVADPSAVAPSELAWEDEARWVVMAVVVGLMVPVTVTHWRRWRLGADLVQFSLAGAAAMVAASVSSLRLGELFHLSWWDYHGYLLAGFVGAVVGIAVSSRRNRAVIDTIADAFDDSPIVHIESGYPEALRALVSAVEAKDPYTHGHSRRTAELAARLGSRMRLGTDDLRALTRGAYLHDVGKIGIDEAILNKPGVLDPVERRDVERHPVLGAEMVRSAPSLAETIDVIRHHHERWDGHGYPDGLVAREIPLLARITAVADVWDALTSDRSYRPGWDPADALAHIVAGASTHFDPALVDLLVEFAYTDLGVRAPSARGDVTVAVTAVENCHEIGAT